MRSMKSTLAIEIQNQLSLKGLTMTHFFFHEIIPKYCIQSHHSIKDRRLIGRAPPTKK